MTRPNIVFVFADQLRSHELGCYGNDQINTPNMDRLAAEGVRFTNAISTHPVCGPYRGMLMTGNWPMKNGLVLTDHVLRNPAPCFAEVCQAAGYATGYVGKWHLDGHGRESCIPPERRLGFEYWRAFECTHNYFESKYYHQDETEPRTWPDYDAISQTREVCDYIRQRDEGPFCLFLSWGAPHDPHVAPQEYMERFADGQLEFRDNVNDFKTAESLWDDSDTVLPSRFKELRKSRQEALEDRDNRVVRQWYQGYYAAIELLDDCLGELLDTLEKTGQLDNTIVVLTSDHGDNLGSHRQMDKQLPFEESISIPFLARYPGKIPPGTVTDALFAPVDVMPTVLALADIPCHDVDGFDFCPAAAGAGGEPREAVLIQKCIALSYNWITNGNGPWCGVRTKSHTYARLANSGKPWMLYDNETDPYQLNNLIGNPDFADLQKTLDERTNALLKATGETDDPLVYAELIQKERSALGFSDRWNELNPERCQPMSAK